MQESSFGFVVWVKQKHLHFGYPFLLRGLQCVLTRARYWGTPRWHQCCRPGGYRQAAEAKRDKAITINVFFDPEVLPSVDGAAANVEIEE